MVIPFPAGGSIDIVGRSIAQRWSAQLSQQIVIDNRSGAPGVIGMQLVANAAADGYTLIYGNAGPPAIGLTTREDSVSVGGTPEDLARLLRSEADRFAKIIKAAGIRAE